ncbi:MAG TPA: hypothetical protein VFB58_13045 [Chloroflexota bacterium]|nr:hypothetical protein [Chloroflexota bacterium]
MAPIETRETLETRKRDLFSAIRLLEQDLEDGTIDPETYRTTRARCEKEAAAVLERLDTLQPVSRPSARPLPLFLTGALVAVALGVSLAAALAPRGTGAVTGTVPTVAPQASALQRAQAYAYAHPNDESAWLRLGNAYLDANQPRLADAGYRRAMALVPADPAPAALHAMMLASLGQRAAATSLLRRIEHAHPTYARAWLLDGMMGLRNHHDRVHALTAFRRFLRLAPHSAVAPTVRIWVRSLTRG